MQPKHSASGSGDKMIFISELMQFFPYGFGVGFGVYTITSLIGYAIRSAYKFIKMA